MRNLIVRSIVPYVVAYVLLAPFLSLFLHADRQQRHIIWKREVANDGGTTTSPCVFDCVHGHCDLQTRNCVCLPGWLGAGCDLCALDMRCLPTEPGLTMVLPQAGALISNEISGNNNNNNNNLDFPRFIYAHGSGLPRARYTCLFGGAESSHGQWLSSTLVRCPIPALSKQSASPAKLAFSLVPAGSNTFIPYCQQQWIGTSAHFTFFTRCESEQCQGHCLGPLCLCPHSRTGQRCEQANLTLMNGTGSADDSFASSRTLLLNTTDDNSALTSASEFRPYIVKLPSDDGTFVHLSIQSDIPNTTTTTNGIVLDPFERILYWALPVGNPRPYRIALQSVGGTGKRVEQHVEWHVRVVPTYSAELDMHLLPANNTTNGRQLSGHIQWLESSDVDDADVDEKDGVKNGTAADKNKNKNNRKVAVASNAPPINSSVPIELHVRMAGEDSSRWKPPIERIHIWTDANGPHQTFRHVMYPYLGVQGHKIAFTAHHPSTEWDNNKKNTVVEWIQERVEVDGYAEEIAIGNGPQSLSPSSSSPNEIAEREEEEEEGQQQTDIAARNAAAMPFALLNYSSLRLSPLNGDCLLGWRFEVIEPRDVFSVARAMDTESNGNHINERGVQLRLQPLVPLEQFQSSSIATHLKMVANINGSSQRGHDDDDATANASDHHGMPLWIAFMCMPSGQSLIVRHTLSGLMRPKQQQQSIVAELYPKRLFIVENSNDVIPLDIRMQNGHTNLLLQRAHLESASFGPFNLVWLSRPTPNCWRLWLTLKSAEFGGEQGKHEEMNNGNRNKEDNSVDGALLIRGAENLALSIPYRIQRGLPPNFSFTLTVKYLGGLLTSSKIPLSDRLVDIELYSANQRERQQQQFVRSILLNNPEQFGPIQQAGGLFQLHVKSRHFLPISSLLQINPLDNAHIIHLQPRAAEYFAFDGHTFEAEWDRVEGFPQPTVQFRPAVFTPERMEQFVDTIYADGPAQSFATVPPAAGNLQQPVQMPMANKHVLCLGCGFRQFVQLQRHNIMLPPKSAANECAALALPMPFWAALPVGSLPAIVNFQQHFLLSYLEDQQNEGELLELEQNADRGELPKVCRQKDHANEDDGVPLDQLQLAMRTKIYRNCALTRLRRCRPLYRAPAARCQHWWHDLPDDLLSIHSMAQFVLMSADCLREASAPESLIDMVECMARVDDDCPMHPHEAEMAPHIGGQLFNQMGYLKHMNAGLQSLFPALDLVESQLVNFPTLLADFLHQLNIVFPPDFMAAFTSDHFYDQFVAAISTNSPYGTQIDSSEFDALLEDLHESGQQLIQKWNWLVPLVSGKRVDLFQPGTNANADMHQLRELVQRADRVKSVTRQFGADNPFAMYREALHRIFSNVAFHQQDSPPTPPNQQNHSTAEGDWQEQVLAWVDVRVEPMEVVEGQEFRVFANLHVRQQLHQSDIFSGIQLDLRFVHATPSSTNNHTTFAPSLKFRIGPVLFAPESASDKRDAGGGQQRHQLGPGEQLRADWTVLPVPESRLTGPIRQQMDLLFAFKLGNQRKAQRIRCPSILIRPRHALRLLTFAYPVISEPNSRRSSPFSLLLSAINSGYSTLDSVRIHQFQPELVQSTTNGNNGRAVNFRIVDIKLEPPPLNVAKGGSTHDEQEDHQLQQSEIDGHLAFGRIPSGKASHLAMNISLVPAFDQHSMHTAATLFRNLSLIVSVNNALLPVEQVEQRFFLIQDTIRDHSMLIVSEHSSPLPLYVFSKRDNALTPLSSLQLIEEKEGRLVLNGHPFLTRAFALRRMALFPAAVQPINGGNQQQKSRNNSIIPAGGAVLATLKVDTATTFGNGAKLLRLVELGTGPVGRQRQLDLNAVWIGRNSNAETTEINFVDMDASPAVPQLIYELLFGRPEHFNAPFFPLTIYQLHLVAPVGPHISQGKQQPQHSAAVVLARMSAAVSPHARPLNYSLWSQQANNPFSIVPSTGDIVLSETLTKSADYCLNLAATDPEGFTTRVPFQISIVGGGADDISSGSNVCQLFAENEENESSSTSLYNHQYKPLDVEVPHEDSDELFGIVSLLSTISPLETETPIVVQEVGGDSTLASIPTSNLSGTNNQLITAGPSYEMVGIGNGKSSDIHQTTTTTRTTTFSGWSASTSTRKIPIQRQRVMATTTTTAKFPTRTMTTMAPISSTSATTLNIRPVAGIDGAQRYMWSTAQQTTTATPNKRTTVNGIKFWAGTVRPAAGRQQQQQQGTVAAVAGNAGGWTGGSVQREGKHQQQPPEESPASANAMVELACRMRATKPIWAVICDIAKTVYRSTLLNV